MDPYPNAYSYPDAKLFLSVLLQCLCQLRPYLIKYNVPLSGRCMWEGNYPIPYFWLWLLACAVRLKYLFDQLVCFWGGTPPPNHCWKNNPWLWQSCDLCSTVTAIRAGSLKGECPASGFPGGFHPPHWEPLHYEILAIPMKSWYQYMQHICKKKKAVSQDRILLTVVTVQASGLSQCM